MYSAWEDGDLLTHHIGALGWSYFGIRLQQEPKNHRELRAFDQYASRKSCYRSGWPKCRFPRLSECEHQGSPFRVLRMQHLYVPRWKTAPCVLHGEICDSVSWNKTPFNLSLAGFNIFILYHKIRQNSTKI